MADYPDWRYFPAFSPPPQWVDPLVSVFRTHRKEIDSLVVHDEPMRSDDVLGAIADDLEGIAGFQVERGFSRSPSLWSIDTERADERAELCEDVLGRGGDIWEQAIDVALRGTFPRRVLASPQDRP